jgi:hypothetical protein
MAFLSNVPDYPGLSMAIVTTWGSPWDRKAWFIKFSRRVYYSTRSIRVAFRRKYHARTYGLPGSDMGL